MRSVVDSEFSEIQAKSSGSMRILNQPMFSTRLFGNCKQNHLIQTLRRIYSLFSISSYIPTVHINQNFKRKILCLFICSFIFC